MISFSKKILSPLLVSVILTACDPFAISKTEGRLDYYMFPHFQHKIMPYAPAGMEYQDTPMIEKNYSIGNQNVAFMGQPMVSFKMHIKRDSNLVRYDKVKVTEDVLLTGSSVPIKISKDQVYSLIGFMKIDNEIFDVMQIKHNEGVLIDRKATFAGRVVRIEKGRVHVISHNYLPHPANAKVVEALTEQSVNNIPINDFELIYSGIRGDKFYLTLMDNNRQVYNNNYNRNGLQSGVYQTFTYDKNTSYINIAGLEIRVLGVHTDKIDFIVTSDYNLVNNYIYP